MDKADLASSDVIMSVEYFSTAVASQVCCSAPSFERNALRGRDEWEKCGLSMRSVEAAKLAVRELEDELTVYQEKRGDFKNLRRMHRPLGATNQREAASVRTST
ncbi:hypothetical protein [Microvirga sp. TS319]|uniref:hypothetical protein n=1 Tax=Microvirga sp. TS319 TaxID=3241165 RepID=UPI003519F7F3